jgi:hypothetical protein
VFNLGYSNLPGAGQDLRYPSPARAESDDEGHEEQAGLITADPATSRRLHTLAEVRVLATFVKRRATGQIGVVAGRAEAKSVFSWS